ncbi:MAG: hypothetical protein ABI690_13645 [Chloroflexota bacterium]
MMTDQYYDKEDDVVETPETSLANWEASANQVANFVPQTAADMNDVWAMLNDIHQRADAQSQTAIAAIWQKVEQFGTRIGQQDGVQQLAKIAYEKNVERRKQIQEELHQIREAIDDMESMGWTESPLLQGVVDVITEQLEEQMVDSGYYIEDPGMEAHANGWYDCLIPENVDALFFALFGDAAKSVPTELREKTAAFINSFGEEMIAIRKAKRAAFMEALGRGDAHSLAAMMDESDLVEVLAFDDEAGGGDEELFDVDD